MEIPVVTAIISFCLVLTTAQLSNEMKKRYLDKHNELRNNVKNFPDTFGNLPGGTPQNMKKLLWDADLAETAQHVADTCDFKHHSLTFPGALRVQYLHRSGGIGENIAKIGGTRGEQELLEKLEQDWVMREIGGGFSWTENRCHGDTCVHMTQVLWAESEFLGCGLADCGDWTFIACHYMSKGNMNGRPPFEVTPDGGEMCTLPGYKADCDYPNLCSGECQPRQVGGCFDNEQNNHCFLLASTRNWCDLSQINNGIRDCAKTCHYCQVEKTCEAFGFENVNGDESRCFKYLSNTITDKVRGEGMCQSLGTSGQLWKPLTKAEYNEMLDMVKSRTSSNTGVWLGFTRPPFHLGEDMTPVEIEQERTNKENLVDAETNDRMVWRMWNFRPDQPNDSRNDGDGEACVARVTLDDWDKIGVDDVRCDDQFHVLCQFDLEALWAGSDVACENEFTDDRCLKTIRREPNMCDSDVFFAYMRCPKACGKCAEIQATLAQYRERLVDMDLGPYKAPNEGILPGTTNCGCD